MRELFPTNKKRGDSFGAGHLNGLSSVANRVGQIRPGGFMRGRHSDSILSLDTPPPFDQVLLEITTDNGDGTYEGKTRYWEEVISNWKTNENEDGWPIDANAMNFGFGISDTIIAYWDEQRGMFIPVYGNAFWAIARVGNANIPKRVGNQLFSAEVSLFGIDSDDKLEAHTDSEGGTVRRDCYNLSSTADIPSQAWIQIARETISGKVIAVWEDCA